MIDTFILSDSVIWF